MSDEEVVDNMVDYMLESIELKIVIYVMTLILYVGRKIKSMMTLNLWLVPLNKILDKNYTYRSLKQLMEKLSCIG